MTAHEKVYVPGDVVETTSGVGVITLCPDSDDSRATFRVMLGREPGKSIATCSEKLLEASAILGKLPIAPGMVTTKRDEDDDKRYMVYSYSPSDKLYRISPLVNENDENSDNNDGDKTSASSSSDNLQRLSRLSLTVPSSDPTMQISYESDSLLECSSTDLVPSASAKFYPLLLELMKRGDQTAKATKAATTEFLAKKEVSNVINKATKFTQEQLEANQEKIISKAAKVTEQVTDNLNNPDEAVEDIAGKVKNAVNDDEVKQLMTMIKDEDLTLLLEKGKERLEKLLQKDIPEATELALSKTGIRIATDQNDPYRDAINQSRQMALKAMEELLQKTEVDANDLKAIQDSLGDNFHSMLDSLTQAAKSDRTLAKILDTVNEQTAEWQEMTGRLLQTKSASLFLEGASRIQSRAANLFTKNQLHWAGEVGSKLTKAFTEGDAAVARLKSIELGDSVRNRLVQAIEVRSESLGGLDGIIAGALTSFKSSSSGSGDQLKEMLTKLQSQATSSTKNTHETLISVLSHESEYRDVALLKVEQVLCDLESHLGEDLSPEDIAAFARGEGGTAKLFEPIAKRAAKEIEKQLDAAEASISDKTMMGVLKHVRKIVSGELTLTAVMDEVVNILNDDNVVAASKDLVKQGEQVLDALEGLEGVSGNKVVDDVMQIAEKAGITKDTVMEGIDKLDVNELLDNAGNAITDEKARRKLLSDATDTALDFILRVLPSMPIPPFDGVKDGLVYHISNLSMQGFKVKKENIFVQVAGMRATKKITGPKIVEVGNGEDAESEVPDAEEVTKDDGSSTSPGRSRTTSTTSADTLEIDFDVDEVVKATELLIIDVSEVSAVFNDAVWGFEQTYFPYLKGNGQFDVDMSNGAIRLVFELRKRRKVKKGNDSGDKGEVEWEPVLCLHDRSCSIGSVDFTMQGGSRLAWVVNKAAAMFKGVLRDYVVRSILRILTDKSGWILSKLNEGLSPFWDVLMRTAKLEFGDLEEASRKDIVAAEPEEETNLIELVWKDRIPLGMNLLLNDESGLLKVVDFPRGSQARTVCEKRNLDPEGFKGATIIAVNGIRHLNDEDLFEALRDPSRPKTVSFELADSEEADRIRKFVEETQEAENPPKGKTKMKSNGRSFKKRTVEFVDDRDLGIEFANAPDNFGLVVRKFLEGDDGIVLAAAREDNIREGDLLTHINGKLVLGEDGEGRIAALKLLESEGSNRPLSLSFVDPYFFLAIYENTKSTVRIGSPNELNLGEKNTPPYDTKRIVVNRFNDVDGTAEKSGVLIGDYLVFINGKSVGAGCRWMGETSAPGLKEVTGMLQDKSNYPIGLTFARPKQTEEKRDWRGSSQKNELLTMENAETLCVTAENYEQLGLILDIHAYSDIVVRDLDAVPGPFQMLTNGLKDAETDELHLSIESVNGEFVPSFATTQMIKSAMDRSWKSEDRVEILFCDDERKHWVQSLLKEDEQ